MKKSIAVRINECHERPKDVAKQYNIPVHRVRQYARQVRNGEMLSNSLGKPFMIDEKSTNTLIESLKAYKATRSKEINHKLVFASQTTKINQGQAACTARMPRWATKQRSMMTNNLIKNVEESTDARYTLAWTFTMPYHLLL